MIYAPRRTLQRGFLVSPFSLNHVLSSSLPPTHTHQKKKQMGFQAETAAAGGRDGRGGRGGGGGLVDARSSSSSSTAAAAPAVITWDHLLAAFQDTHPSLSRQDQGGERAWSRRLVPCEPQKNSNLHILPSCVHFFFYTHVSFLAAYTGCLGRNFVAFFMAHTFLSLPLTPCGPASGV